MIKDSDIFGGAITQAKVSKMSLQERKEFIRNPEWDPEESEMQNLIYCMGEKIDELKLELEILCHKSQTVLANDFLVRADKHIKSDVGLDINIYTKKIQKLINVVNQLNALK